MRKLLTIFFFPFFFFAVIDLFFTGNRTNVPNDAPATIAKENFVLTLIGYIKIGNGGFGASDGCGATNLITAVYSDTRTELGQIGQGDILKDAGGNPIAGGGQGYGFTITNGGNATRGIKLGGASAGYVDAVDLCSGSTTTDWFAASGTNCSQTSFPTALYNDPSDPLIYVGKKLPISTGGSLLSPDGFYTLGMSATGPAVYTVSVAAGLITAISSTCITNPIVDAGADQTVSLPSPSITLSGSAFDPNGTITDYTWSQQSGPNTATIGDDDNQVTGITGVMAGTYVFRLTATDNASNTGYDEVSVTVVAAPLCVTATLIKAAYRDITDFSGASGEGSQRLNDTTGSRKWASTWGAAAVMQDGDANPRIGNFDYNATVAGTQTDSTSIAITRASIHPGNTVNGQTYGSYFILGNGSQRVIIFDYKQIVNFEAVYIHHSTGEPITNAGEIIFTSNPLEVKRALFEYDSRTTGLPLTIDVTFSLGSGAYDSIINLRHSARYVIWRLNANDAYVPKQGPNIKNIFTYGCSSASLYTGTEIFPDWNTSYTRDTTEPVKNHDGKVVATPTGSTDMDQTFPNSTSWGGYINAIDTVAGAGGIGDTTNQDFNISNSAFKVNLAMYGDNNLFNPANKYSHETYAYMAVTNPNRYLLKQLYNNGNIVNQHIPINKLGMDIRLQATYSRFVWYYTTLVAVLGPDVPDPASAYTAFITGRAVGYWTGGSGHGNNVKQIFPLNNEENADFRPGGAGAISQSSWLPPVAMWALHDTALTVWRSVFPNRPFVMQGMAANGLEYIILGDMFGKIWYQDKNYRMADVVNIHTITVKNIPDIDGGCTGNIDQQSVLDGYRNTSEKLQAFLDTLAITRGGVYPKLIITEYSTASSKDWQLPITGCDFNLLSVPFIPTRPSYRPHHAQGYVKLQQQIKFESIQGLWRSWQYEAFDLTDTVSPGGGVLYFNGNDGSQGDINLAHNWMKANLYLSQQHNGNNFLREYRVWAKIFDSTKGQYKALYRHIDAAKRDSFCYLTMWQQLLVDPPGNRTHTFPADVSTIRHMRHTTHTNYAGTNVGSTLTGNTLAIPSVFEPDMMFFKSPVLAAQLDALPAPTGEMRFRKYNGLRKG